jgi:predicted nuclease of predicted toxin-antitoxin system
MKFIFDAHLPPSLCKIVEDRGHEALTTKDLPFGNSSTDEQITAFSAQEDWVVVTKDKDFYFSHILNRSPRRLLLVRCGNYRLRDMCSLFERHMPEIEAAFERADLVELFSDQVVPRAG